MKTTKFRFLAVLLTVTTICILKTTSASAATINVVSGTDGYDENGQCQLTEAIQNINDQSATNVDCAAGDDLSDTIVLPSGSITLSGDLSGFAKDVKIVGAGIDSSIINGSSTYKGFTCNGGYENDIFLEGLTVTSMVEYGFQCHNVKSINLKNVDINQSGKGAYLVTKNVEIDGSRFHDNKGFVDIGAGDMSGLHINIKPLSSINDEVSLLLNETKIYNNSTDDAPLSSAGLQIRYETVYDSQTITTTPNIEIYRTTVYENISKELAGVYIGGDYGPLTAIPLKFRMDSTTIHHNTVIATDPQTVTPGLINLSVSPRLAGLNIIGNLSPGQNVTNVTVAYNSITVPAGDNRLGIAGFLGALNANSANLSIVSTTIVSNSISQPNAQTNVGAFLVNKLDLAFNNGVQVTSLTNGATALNSLISNNSSNAVIKNCLGVVNNAYEGIEAYDVTPTNQGYNISDDQSCTGYKHAPNLYNTIEHEVKNNGGFVPTIALLAGSPAINSGGQVLGISTDARGVARQGYYSSGAYQGVLAATTSAPALAETGVAQISTIFLLGVIISCSMYVYLDYRKHKAPLVAADPKVSYSLAHHIKVVSIPLLRYRLMIGLAKSPNNPSSSIRRS